MNSVKGFDQCVENTIASDFMYAMCLHTAGFFEFNSAGGCSSPCTDLLADGTLSKKCCTVLEQAARCSPLVPVPCTDFLASLPEDDNVCRK